MRLKLQLKVDLELFIILKFLNKLIILVHYNLRVCGKAERMSTRILFIRINLLSIFSHSHFIKINQ